MCITIIGMSGCGKTHWSREFAKEGFKHFCCDDLISRRLSPVLARPDGSILDLGQWMGFPYEPNYEDREAQYLTHEIAVLRQIIEYLENHKEEAEKNIIVDTTGSVIYTGDEMLARLRNETTVVHLETTPQVRDLMLQKYLTAKRPVLWQGLFRPTARENNQEALARCYRNLLASREREYARHAHCSIDYHTHNQAGLTFSDFVRLVKTSQPSFI